MLRQIVRIAATGISFTVFGLGCIMVFPVAFLATFLADSRAVATRRFISFFFRCFARMMRGLGLLTYEFSHLDRISGRCVIVANHPSLIDVVFLLGWIKDANCVVKGNLFRNPLTATAVTVAGYANSEAPGFLSECQVRLSEGCPLLIFPEGTRTKPGGSITLLRGAAHIALEAKVPIFPVAIEMEPMTLGKGDHWWTVPKAAPDP
jgi:1-acyl-sn-glycerol-3-phosphate acyltransferase